MNNPELKAYAVEVRQALTRLVGPNEDGRKERVTELLEAMFERNAEIERQAGVQEPGRYDLADLPPVLEQTERNAQRDEIARIVMEQHHRIAGGHCPVCNWYSDQMAAHMGQAHPQWGREDG